MYKLSALTLAAMVTAGLLVGDPTALEADAAASEAPRAGVVMRRANDLSLGVTAPGAAAVAAAEAEAGAAAPVSDQEAIEIALLRGDEVTAARQAERGSNTRTLEAIFAAPAPTDTMPADAWAVSGNWVNLRAGPGTGHAVVTQAGLGDVMSPLSDTSKDWVNVRLPDGREAWIFGKYLAPRS